ncbi:MAG: hypothetical protein MJZ34_06985 [Paludibacteraceae bacterium]|nr:hypothetical protein [Paludibacteraceae bacterium]
MSVNAILESMTDPIFIDVYRFLKHKNGDKITYYKKFMGKPYIKVEMDGLGIYKLYVMKFKFFKKYKDSYFDDNWCWVSYPPTNDLCHLMKLVGELSAFKKRYRDREMELDAISIEENS